MSSTNKTTNYELPQWLGTDKPTFLGDLNGAFLVIDGAMKDNATAASGANTLAGTADGKADANALAIQTLNEQINTPGTGLAADVAANALAIQGVAEKVGTGTLDTTAQNLIGAVNELNGEVNPGSVSVTADGVKTFKALIEELAALVDFTKLAPGKSVFMQDNIIAHPFNISSDTMLCYVLSVNASNGNVEAVRYKINASAASYVSTVIEVGGTVAFGNHSSDVPVADTVFKIVY